MGVDLTGYEPKRRRSEAVEADERRAAAVHVADRVGAEHSHPLDDLMPRLAGRLIAEDPAVRDDVTDLLDALGLKPDQVRRTP